MRCWCFTSTWYTETSQSARQATWAFVGCSINNPSLNAALQRLIRCLGCKVDWFPKHFRCRPSVRPLSGLLNERTNEGWCLDWRVWTIRSIDLSAHFRCLNKQIINDSLWTLNAKGVFLLLSSKQANYPLETQSLKSNPRQSVNSQTKSCLVWYKDAMPSINKMSYSMKRQVEKRRNQ